MNIGPFVFLRVGAAFSLKRFAQNESFRLIALGGRRVSLEGELALICFKRVAQMCNLGFSYGADGGDWG